MRPDDLPDVKQNVYDRIGQIDTEDLADAYARWLTFNRCGGRDRRDSFDGRVTYRLDPEKMYWDEKIYEENKARAELMDHDTLVAVVYEFTNEMWALLDNDRRVAICPHGCQAVFTTAPGDKL